MANESQRTKGDGSTGKAALKKTMGPLPISNIGLRFKENKLSFSLQGVAVAVEKPPLTVAGGLFHEGECWAGGVGTCWTPCNFIPGTRYRSVPDPDGAFKPAFVLTARDGHLLPLHIAGG
ncbi:hypothetical protein ACHAO9_012412 [Fusarium lateritium]